MIKAAFFDIDGTLLSHKTKTVPKSTRASLEKMRAAGICCIAATGRHLQEMKKLPVGDIEFDGYITLNGQLCLDSREQIISGTPIAGRDRDTIIQIFRDHEIPMLMVEKDGIYINFVNERVHRVQSDISSDIPAVGNYTGKEIYQAVAYVDDREAQGLKARLAECEITRWNPGGVDIIAGGGGKAAAIRRYLEEAGIRREESIAFGDGLNDMEMLWFAGIGVAMGNAEESVKQIADYITADIDDDGIEKALKHFELI